MLMNRAMVIFVLTFSVYGEVVRQDYEQATEFAGRANDSAGSSPAKSASVAWPARASAMKLMSRSIYRQVFWNINL